MPGTRCAACGFGSRDVRHLKRCGYGSDVAASPSSDGKDDTPEGAESSASGMRSNDTWKCGECGERNPASWDGCGSCGLPSTACRRPPSRGTVDAEAALNEAHEIKRRSASSPPPLLSSWDEAEAGQAEAGQAEAALDAALDEAGQADAALNAALDEAGQAEVDSAKDAMQGKNASPAPAAFEVDVAGGWGGGEGPPSARAAQRVASSEGVADRIRTYEEGGDAVASTATAALSLAGTAEKAAAASPSGGVEGSVLVSSETATEGVLGPDDEPLATEDTPTDTATDTATDTVTATDTRSSMDKSSPSRSTATSGASAGSASPDVQRQLDRWSISPREAVKKSVKKSVKKLESEFKDDAPSSSVKGAAGEPASPSAPQSPGSPGSPGGGKGTILRRACGLPNCTSGISATKKCTACKATWYCSREHQRSDWKAHKVACPGGTAAKHTHNVGYKKWEAFDVDAELAKVDGDGRGGKASSPSHPSSASTHASRSRRAAAPRTHTALARGREDQNFPVGAASIGAYVLIWLASLLSPALLSWSLLTKRWKSAGALAALAVLAYVPNLPRLAWLRDLMGRTAAMYWPQCSITYEEGSLGFPASKAMAKKEKAKKKKKKAQQTKKRTPTLLCVAPHGIFCMGWGLLFASPELKRVRFCFARALYLSPYFRLLCRLIGRPASADKDSMVRLMKKGEDDLALIPGGFEEASIHTSTTDRVFLKDRMGFAKYALQYGYSLTPCFAFGERNTFNNVQGGWGLRRWLNGFGFPAIIPYGHWAAPFMPQPVPLHVVVGAPITPDDTEHDEDGGGTGGGAGGGAGGGGRGIANPTRAQVACFHAKYVEGLKQLYRRHAETYYGKKTEAKSAAKSETKALGEEGNASSPLQHELEVW